MTGSWPARTRGSKRPSRCVGSWPDSDRRRRLHGLAAGGLFDREQERAADFVERLALGLHCEDFEPHGAQAPSALGFAAGEMASRLLELALHEAAAAFQAPYSFERLMQISLEHENLVRFVDRLEEAILAIPKSPVPISR